MRRMLQLACLCAAWCRTCDAYEPVIREVAAEFGLEPRWIDIEDEADLVGDVDVPTFPTLLLQHGAEVRFYGPITPQPEMLRRLLRSADTRVAAAPEVQALATRLARG